MCMFKLADELAKNGTVSHQSINDCDFLLVSGLKRSIKATNLCFNT